MPHASPTPPAIAAPPAGDHLALIDLARAAAILLVAGFHLSIECFGGLAGLESRLTFTDLHPGHFLLALMPFSYGFTGVAVFFFISGFCIHLSYARSRAGGYKTFYIRRLFRIYPPYFVALCFFALFFPPTRLPFDSALNVAQFGSHLLMVHNLDHRSFYGINGSFWSLGIEVQLYLIYPLLLRLVRKWGWNRALLAAGAVEAAFRAAMSTGHPLPFWLTATPFSYWFSWSIGARLADDYLNRRPFFASRPPLWIWLAALGLAFRFAPAFVFPCVALLTGALMARGMGRAAALPAWNGPVFRAIQAIGVGSYSLYLLHQPLLAWAAGALRAVFPGHPFTPVEIAFSLLVASLAFIPVCWLFYRAVELPGIELGKRIVRRAA